MKNNDALVERSPIQNPIWEILLHKSKRQIIGLITLFFTLIGFANAYGQVTINTANGNINSCVYPTSYVALGDIYLEENQNANFGFANRNNYTLIITAPINFEFKPSQGTVTYKTNGDITAASINVTSTTITVTYLSDEGSRTNEDDRLTISGIEFRGITGPSSGNMTRTGGTGVINGAAIGAIFGTLTSTNTRPASVVASPSPANGATGVCYLGTGSISSISWSAAAGATSYDVYFGAGGIPGTPNANVIAPTLTFNTGALLANTTYYWRIVPRNSCGITTGSPVTWSFTTSAEACSCTVASEEPQRVYIDDVRFMGTLNDVDNLNTGFSTGYQNFTTRPKAIQAQGEGVNVYYNNYSYSGSAHVKAWVDWDKDGNFVDAEEVYDTGLVTTSSATFGFVIPTTMTPGDYRIRIRNNVSYSYLSGAFNYDFTACEDFYYTFWEDFNGEAEDYLFTVIPSCNANIVTATNGERCGAGTVDLAVTGTASATGYNWYSTENGGTAINPTPTGSTWTTPSLTTTTTYWVTAVNGCESLKRTKIIAEIKPTPIVSFTPSAPVICGETAILQLTAGGDVETVTLINENFEGVGLGVFNNVNSTPNGAPYDAITVWQNQISTYLPTNT